MFENMKTTSSSPLLTSIPSSLQPATFRSVAAAMAERILSVANLNLSLGQFELDHLRQGFLDACKHLSCGKGDFHSIYNMTTEYKLNLANFFKSHTIDLHDMLCHNCTFRRHDVSLFSDHLGLPALGRDQHWILTFCLESR